MKSGKFVGPDRAAVIENIRRAVAARAFNVKVEEHDPTFSEAQETAIIDHYLHQRQRWTFRVKTLICRLLVNANAVRVTSDVEVVGVEKIRAIKSGGVITSNHFSPFENMAIRKAVRLAGRHRMYIVSQDTNLAMKGLLGFVMNYDDTIPLSGRPSFLNGPFMQMLTKAFSGHHWVLIYPEQEMWFNYRKPRPPKRGSYFYAAEAGVPIISCFTEIRDLKARENDQLREVSYVLHVLDPIYPDRNLSVRDNSFQMMQRDYAQKRQAYEAAYGKPLTYAFSDQDIAGWDPQ